jgi:hypothetical protein
MVDGLEDGSESFGGLWRAWMTDEVTRAAGSTGVWPGCPLA